MLSIPAQRILKYLADYGPSPVWSQVKNLKMTRKTLFGGLHELMDRELVVPARRQRALAQDGKMREVTLYSISGAESAQLAEQPLVVPISSPNLPEVGPGVEEHSGLGALFLKANLY